MGKILVEMTKKEFRDYSTGHRPGQVFLQAEKPPRPSRVKEAVDLHEANPTWTLVRIGQEMGVSRERVRQLLTKEGIRIGHQKRIALTQKEGDAREITN